MSSVNYFMKTLFLTFLQDENVSTFIEKLVEKAATVYSKVNITEMVPFLRESKAAATFDAVITMALAYHEIARNSTCGITEVQVLNKTLSDIKFKGLAVSSSLSSFSLQVSGN